MNGSPALRLLCALLPLACLGAAGDTPARKVVDPDAGPFSIVLVPDTQHEVETRSARETELLRPWQYERFERNADWICENRDARNIAAVLHLGDVVQHAPPGEDAQWSRAATLLDRLEGCGIPYLVAMGNHDCVNGTNGCTLEKGTERGANFQHFVQRRQQGQPEWRGTGPRITRADGAAARCGLGGAASAPSRLGKLHFAGRFGAVSMGFLDCPAQDDWVRSAVRAEQGKRHLILVGHAAVAPGRCALAPRAAEIAAAGTSVFMVAGGHWIPRGLPNKSCYSEVAAGPSRPPLVAAFANFQTNSNERIAGTLVLMRIDPTAAAPASNVCLREYNPSRERWDVTKKQEQCFRVALD